MLDTIWTIHYLSTFIMIGIIWFVQIVHYPMFSIVGEENFIAYEKEHVARTGFVVIPPMLAEMITGVILLCFIYDDKLFVANFMLLFVIWLSTFLWQAPAHGRLEEKFEPTIHKFLVTSNWIRTICWTIRGFVLATM